MLYLACDHAGFEFMQKIKKYLTQQNIPFVSCGADEFIKTDGYPTYVKKANQLIAKSMENRGIYVCGAGPGINMAANRHKRIRAVVGASVKYVYAARWHQDANVLVIPGGYIKVSLELAKKMIQVFFETSFEGGRHIPRLQDIGEYPF